MPHLTAPYTEHTMEHLDLRLKKLLTDTRSTFQRVVNYNSFTTLMKCNRNHITIHNDIKIAIHMGGDIYTYTRVHNYVFILKYLNLISCFITFSLKHSLEFDPPKHDFQ